LNIIEQKAEQIIIASILAKPELFDEAIKKISPKDFIDRKNQEIFQAMNGAFLDGKLPTFMNIITRTKGVSQEYFIKLMEITPLYLDFALSLEQLREASKKRKLKNAVAEMNYMLSRREFKPEQLASLYSEKLGSIVDVENEERNDITELVDNILEKKQKVENGENLIEITTGYNSLNWLTDGFHKTELTIIAARPAVGKCLGKGTLVLMYDGTLKEVEKIKVGDLLMGNDSTPRRVLSIAHGREMMYWVRQKHGIDYRVNESHILSLKRSRREGGYKKGEVLNISVKDYLKKSAKWKSNYKGYKTAVEFPHKDVPLDPYLFGLWLGDGSSRSSHICTPDEEVVDYLKQYAEKTGQFVTVDKQKGKCPMYTITGGRSAEARKKSVQAILRKMNVLNNKHIPQIYLINDKDTRLQLLAGLIDSDGYINKNSGRTIEITNKSERLAYQIKFLCDTLGYRTSIRKKKGRIASRNFEGTYWRVHFNGNVDEIPTRIKRKQTKKWTSNIDWQVTGITVEPDKIDDYYGFEIDGNGLFLLEDCTVTHNTALTLNFMLRQIKQDIPVLMFSLEMSKSSLYKRLFSIYSGVEASKINKGQLNESEVKKIIAAADFLESKRDKLFIIDKSSITINDMIVEAKTMKNKGIQVIYIDYLQLLNTESVYKNRAIEMGEISRNLKILAKELDVAVVAIAQLNREVEHRTNKRPNLADLRDSGEIEQNADNVWFLYREGYYLEQKGEEDKNDSKTELSIAKHRNGPTGVVNLVFRKNTLEFLEEGKV